MSLDLAHIGAAVAAANGADDEFMAVIAGLTPLATKSLRGNITFDHEDVQIAIGGRGRFARVVERLTRLEPLKLGPAPVVAALFSTNEVDVLVLKYWAVPGEQRLALDPAHQPSAEARRRLRDDLLKLANAGWMHEYAQRGTLYWRVGSKTGTVVLEDWTALEPIEDKDQVVAMLAGMA
jgi:hypothetical protein